MNRDPWSKRKNLYSTPMPKEVKDPKVKLKIWPIVYLALKRTCMAFGATFLVILVMTAWILSSVVDEVQVQSALPNQMVLYMELDGKLADLPGEASFANPFTKTYKTVKTFTDALEYAKTDKRVDGIYAHVKPGNYALAHIQEMRAAIKDFRESGKFAYIYAPSYDNGLGSYLLASSFEEIWMQPMGTVVINGINAEMPFIRSALDKIGIEPQFFQRKEYKTAYESLTNSRMSDANRREMKELVDNLAEILVEGISEDRALEKDKISKLVDQGLFLAEEAKEKGLVDKIDYDDKLAEFISFRLTGDPKSKDISYVNFDVYMGDVYKRKQSHGVFDQVPGAGGGSKPRVALVYASGVILDSNGEQAAAPSGLMDDGVAAADEISAALLTAAQDETVDAVVLRVDSPGGSPVASETILRAVEVVKEAGKTVTVSMGPTAASGGYWISAYADRIFVLPSTLTGSIGVVGGKISMKQLWQNIEVNWDRVGWGENSTMWSSNAPFSKSEAERINAMLDHVYDSFVERVAKGRNMSIEDVEKIARGRVWTGLKALDVGLADQFGGLNEALDYAAVQAGAPDRDGIDIVVLPKPLSSVERLIKLIEGQVRVGEIMGVQATLIERFKPLISQILAMENAQERSVYNPVQIQQ